MMAVLSTRYLSLALCLISFILIHQVLTKPLVGDQINDQAIDPRAALLVEHRKPIQSRQLRDQVPAKRDIRDQASRQRYIRDQAPAKRDIRNQAPKRGDVLDQALRQRDLGDQAPGKGDILDQALGKRDSNVVLTRSGLVFIDPNKPAFIPFRHRATPVPTITKHDSSAPPITSAVYATYTLSGVTGASGSYSQLTTTGPTGQSTILPVWFGAGGIALVVVLIAGVAGPHPPPPPPGYEPLGINSDGDAEPEEGEPANDDDNNNDDDNDDHDDDDNPDAHSTSAYGILEDVKTSNARFPVSSTFPSLPPSLTPVYTYISSATPVMHTTSAAGISASRTVSLRSASRTQLSFSGT